MKPSSASMLANLMVLLTLAAANAAWAVVSWRSGKTRHTGQGMALASLAVALACALVTSIGHKLETLLQLSFKYLLTPVGICLLVWTGLISFLWLAPLFTKPEVAWALVNLLILMLSAGGYWPEILDGLADSETFAVSVMAVVSLFFVWYGMKQAVDNDRRKQAGLAIWESTLADKVPTWPNLVYMELVCILVVLTGIFFWSLWYPAPLEAPANAAWTPNPAKAPWYFVGIQELLVYFDASVAGVVLPGLMILGLILLPYVDNNPRGNGYYTLTERPLAVPLFVFGFVGVWWFLIAVGFFLRGADWAFVGAGAGYQLTPVTKAGRGLSEVFWSAVGVRLPIWSQRPDAAIVELPPLFRELPGLILLTLSLVGLPILLGQTIFKKERREIGWKRFYLSAAFFLLMASIPLKMLVYNLAGINFIVAFPEWRVHF
ncbi:MAG: hypothetical protein NZ899_00710 [Thermoguttaceae bacterium]|nr:hypothetical protein [Thermoguttaceae bacterium]MDW8077416.1 hypothetical protein [Thermoguttaceae bacterium]